MKSALVILLLASSVTFAQSPRAYVEIKSSLLKDEVTYFIDGKPHSLIPLKEDKLVNAFSHNPEAHSLMVKHQSMVSRGTIINLVGSTILLGSLIGLKNDEQTIGLAIGGGVALLGGYYQRQGNAYLNEAINKYNGVGTSKVNPTGKVNSRQWLSFNWSI